MLSTEDGTISFFSQCHCARVWGWCFHCGSGGSNGHTSNNGKQGQVDVRGEDLSKEKKVQKTGHNGFRGLDNVSKGDGTSTKSNHGTNVDTSVAEGNGEEGLKVGEAQLRRKGSQNTRIMSKKFGVKYLILTKFWKILKVSLGFPKDFENP